MSMSLKASFVQLLNRREHRRFVEACVDPVAARDELWREMLGVLGKASFWRGMPRELADFEITTYADYAPVLADSFAKADATAVSPLNGEPVLFWCQSSGTTARRKTFPLTATYFRQLKRTTAPYAHRMMSSRPEFLDRKVLYFASTAAEERSPAGVEVGFISHYFYKNLPSYVRRRYAFPAELLASQALFDAWAPLYALANDLSGILAITPAMITRLYRSALAEKAKFLAVLRGDLPWPADLPRVKVSAERLARVERAFAQNAPMLRDFWPELSVITTWKSSTCGLQLRELEPLLDEKILVTDGQYSATEGWMTVPFIDARVGSCFHPGAMIVEFLEEGSTALGKNLRQSWELVEGKSYEVVVTNTMGLVRYRLFDVVLCTGFAGRAPILSFVGKADCSVSLGQTRFSELNLLEALRVTGFQTDIPWAIAPSRDGRRMEFLAAAPNEGLEARVAELDRAWARINPEILSDYDSGLLDPMAFRVLGASHALWEGARHHQAKPRLLVKNPVPPIS